MRDNEGGPEMPDIPKTPTRQNAERALALIDGLLEEFPFADADRRDQSINRAVALSMLLTPVLLLETWPVPQGTS